MTIENSLMRDHIRQTLETIERFHGSADIKQQKLLSQMIGDQYEVLIDLSASELRAIACDSAAAIVAESTGGEW